MIDHLSLAEAHKDAADKAMQKGHKSAYKYHIDKQMAHLSRLTSKKFKGIEHEDGSDLTTASAGTAKDDTMS